MNFIQRALKSVTRKKGKSLILFLVIFVLGNVIAGAVAIQQSTGNVEKETKKKMGALATAEVDYEKINKMMEKDPSLSEDQTLWQSPTTEQIQAIGALSYVKNYDFSSMGHIGSNKFKSKTSQYMGFGDNVKYHFSLKGTNQGDFIDLSEGKIKMSEGATFTADQLKEGQNGVLVSKEVAELNNLNVGDEVVLDVAGEEVDTSGWERTTDDSGGEITEASEPAEPAEPKPFSFDYPVKVLGVFTVVRKEQSEDAKEEDKGMAEIEAIDQINTIYMPNSLVSEINKKYMAMQFPNEPEIQENSEYFNNTFVLKSPDDAEAFRQEADALLGENQHIVLSSDQYDQVAGPLKKLDNIAKYVVLFASLATLLIISLVVLLFLRDRKKELGVYLSLGESRSKVIGQIVVELLLISIFALVLSLVTGNLLGGAVSDTLMQSDWINQGDNMGYYGSSLDTAINQGDIMSAYQVKFTPLYVVSYLGLGLGTILLSAIIPLLYILRLNPKKIMM